MSTEDRYNLLLTSSKYDFFKLGFKSFNDSKEDDPRDHYFELIIGEVEISLDAWCDVKIKHIKTGVYSEVKAATIADIEDLILLLKRVQNIKEESQKISLDDYIAKHGIK